MFIREKFSKSTQFFTHSGASKNLISSNKYFQKSFKKKSNQISKKQKNGRIWKKNSSNFWSEKEKENDINNIKHPFNKHSYFESKKSFRYHKKISKTKFDYNYTEGEIENAKDNKDDLYFYKRNSKDEKNNSIEYAATAAYSISNSSSVNEDNINMNNLEQKGEINNFLIQKRSSFDNYEIINNSNNNSNYRDLSEQLFANLMQINMNLIRINTNNEISKYTPPQSQKKPEYKKKNSNTSTNNTYSSIQYNKYNNVNQDDINKSLIHPMAENTEILNVYVKISKNKKALFKLRRFDDLFLTVKLFCEINQIEEKFIKPIIIKTLCSLNSLYQIYNAQMDAENIQRLKRINTYINNIFI